MKAFNQILGGVLAGVAATMIVALAAQAQNTNATDTAKSKPAPYPLTTCIVSGEKLGGDMGDPVVFVYQDKAKGINQEVKFCCSMCKPKFLKDPDKYMKVIQEAEAKAKNKDDKN